jgi:hypothetical protein
MNSLRYRFFHGGRLIGSSSLEFSDPSMGVRSGRFFPDAAYATLEPFFQAFMDVRCEADSGNSEQQAALQHRVRQFQQRLAALHLRLEAPSGEEIPTGFIDIMDAAAALEDESAREVMVQIPEYPTYFSDLD